jgi:hypothetical protein
MYLIIYARQFHQHSCNKIAKASLYCNPVAICSISLFFSIIFQDKNTMPHFPHRPFLAVMTLSVALSAPALAHEAHVHGIAAMDVIVDQQQVTLMLTSPLANLIGFEHAPKTDKDRQSVRNMAAQLRQADASFVPTPAAQCTLTKVTLTSDTLPADLLGETARSAKPAHNHGHDHKTAHNDKHAHEKSHSHAHGDLNGSFVFSCKNVQQLQYIDVPLMTAFTGINRLNVQIATQARQSAATLSATATRIQLK